MGIVTMELPIPVKRDLISRLTGHDFTPKAAAKIVAKLTQYSTNYERFLADADVEVFPVLLNESRNTIRRKMRNLDGLLLIGGAPGIHEPASSEGSLDIFLNEKSTRRYFGTIGKIMDHAKYINQNLRPFAVFGICMGFEAMLLHEVDFALPLTKIGKQNVNDKVYLTFNGRNFLDFVKASSPADVLGALDRGQVYFNNEKGISVQNFLKNVRLNGAYEVVGYYRASVAGAEEDYVGMVEHRRFPFFGIQFHPEKNLYETSEHFKADHSEGSKKAAKVFQGYLAFLSQKIGSRKKGFETDFDFSRNIQSLFFDEIEAFKNLQVFGPDNAIQAVSQSLN